MDINAFGHNSFVHTKGLVERIEMKAGDRIKWSYRHFLNSKSSFIRTKCGVYVRLVKHPTPPTTIWPQCAVVQFDGNKKVSRVPCCDIKLIEDEENDSTQ